MKQKIKLGLSLIILLVFAWTASGVHAQHSAASSNILLVDDFDQAFAANHLGGAYGLVAEGGQAHYQFIQPSVPYLANNSALKIGYELTAHPGYAFLWMKLGKHKENHEESEYVDLSSFVFLSFKYKSPKDINFKIEIHEDLDGDGRFSFASDRVSFVYTDGVKKFDLGGDWHKVLIPLKRFGAVKDWSKILEMVFVFEKDHVGTTGELFLEDLMFIRKELKKQDGDPSTDMLKGVQIQVNGQTPASGMALEGRNRIHLAYQAAAGFDEVESISLQLRTEGEQTWSPVVTEFNPGASETDLVWETFTFNPPGKVALRVVVHDFLGKEKIVAGPFEDLTIPALTDEKFLDLVEEKAFLYFVETQHESGLFYDTTGGGDLSIAVTGFGLTALVIGVERGWITKEEAQQKTLKCLDSFLTKVDGHEGLYYHFVNAQTLKRAGTSEVSTVDTALLFTGTITAGEYFGGEVKSKADELYKRANWSYFLNKNEDEEHYMKFHHGWTPEEQLADNFWDYYTDETLMLDLLGIGAPKNEVPAEVFYAFLRRKGQYKERPQFIYTWHGGLFSYQYANAWYDFRNLVDRDGVNWYENSKEATLSNRQFVMDGAADYKTYGEDSWGITSMRVPERYIMHYGPLPNGQNKAEHDGTIAPSGPGGSLMFTPYHSLRALKHLYLHHPELWGIYGFKDSINVDRNWISPVYYGLGEGILLLSIENFRTGLVWKLFSKNKDVRKSFELAEFKEQAKESLLPAYEAQKKEALALEKKKADPQALGQAYRKLLATLQQDDVELMRVYLKEGDEYKNKALQYFDSALESALSETDRLEILRNKIEILNSVLAPAEREQVQERLAQELKDGVKKETFNLAWVLKWSEELDEDTALKVRREFHADLSPVQRKVLNDAIKKKSQQAFTEGDYRKAALLIDEQVDFFKEQEDKSGLVEFLRTSAKSFTEVKKYVEAERFYRRIADEFGTPAEREAVRADLARMLEIKGDKERAIEEYQDLIKDYPKSERIPEALFRMANIESSLERREKAVALLEKIIKEYPATSHAEESTYLLGMVYYHAGRYKEAIQAWEGFLKQYPESRRVQVVQDYLERADRKEAERA